MTTTMDHLQAECYDYLVFIGRFQPFHLGHQAVIKAALTCSDRVIVLVGSSHQPRSTRNPWTFDERQQFIKGAFSNDDACRVLTAPLVDLYNDEKWVALVESVVQRVVEAGYQGISPNIGLIGHSKDHSSYYLSLFPQWQGVNVDAYEMLSATPLRDYYYSEGKVPHGLPKNVALALSEQLQTEEYAYIREESAYIRAYKKSWSLAPSPPLLVTVEAVVVQAGHVLLVERKNALGKGLLALPSGGVDVHERLISTLLRVLREEAQIEIEASALLERIVKKEVFDSPYRSVLGRTISHAYCVALEGGRNEWVERLANEVKYVFWVPIAEINAEILFEDHAYIIKTMLS